MVYAEGQCHKAPEKGRQSLAVYYSLLFIKLGICHPGKHLIPSTEILHLVSLVNKTENELGSWGAGGAGRRGLWCQGADSSGLQNLPGFNRLGDPKPFDYT